MARGLVEKINADLVKAVTSPDIVKRYADAGVEVAAGTPDQFLEFARAEHAKWAKVVKDSGASAD
jgi:tripartite-type tricarboxylate transporter receptor subunit TctC